MLRHWFNKACTLAISNQGVVLFDENGQIHSLSDENLNVQLPLLGASATKNLNHAPLNPFSELLLANKALLRNKSLNIIISNTFVRYLVLPWQPSVLTKADWQAIAQNAFHQTFGSVANNWHAIVHLGAHQETVLAAAIDSHLMAQLESAAKQINVQVLSINPLLSTLLNLYGDAAKKSWFLVAEPQRLLLCQFKNQQLHQIFVESPPSGQEYQQANQLIQRSMLPVAASQQPSKIISIVSAALSGIWQDKIGSRQQVITIFNGFASHANWIARLGEHNHLNTMRSHTVNLNFVKHDRAPTQFGSALLFASACALAVFLWFKHADINNKTNDLKQVLSAKYSLSDANLGDDNKLNTRNKPNANNKNAQGLNESELILVNAAQQVQLKLNAGWMPMLAALEAVKNENPAVLFTKISPNSQNGKIKLNGEAHHFEEITQLINSFRASAIFDDAVLVNQHLEEDTSRPNDAPIVVFEMNIGWQQ